jgi:hypothetical protein
MMPGAQAVATTPAAQPKRLPRFVRRLPRVLTYLPPTRRFRWRLHLLITKYAKQRMQRFDALKVLDAATKNQVRPQIRKFETQLAAVETWEYIFTLAMFLVLPAAIIVGQSFVQFYSSNDPLNIIPVPAAGWLKLVHFVLFLISLVIWFYIFFWPALMFAKGDRIASLPLIIGWPMILTCVYAVGYFYIYTHFQAGPARYSIYLLIAVLRGAYLYFYIFLVVLLVTPVALVVSYAFGQRKRALYPQATICDGLLALLALLEKYPTDWLTQRHKRTMITQMEDVATCIERELLNQLRAGDAGTNAQMTELAVEMAAAMRDFKQWVLTPKPDTYEHLRRALADNFLQATTGHWDFFWRRTPLKVSLAEGIGKRATGSLRTLAGGALPVLVLLTVRRLGLPLDGQLAQYLTFGVVLWSVITLLRLIDPHFGSTLDSLDKIKSLLPGLGKGKSD